MYMRLEDELGDDILKGYSGCFIYGGEVYTRTSYSDRKALDALQGLHAKHPNDLVRAAALKGIICCLDREIRRKYCL